jgi:plastocyanin
MCILAVSLSAIISPALGQNDTSAKPALTIHMKNLAFDPASATATVGETVTFVNDDSVSHNVTGGEIGSSGDIAAGKSWKYTFDKPGDYKYVCTYHQGMAGEITVTAAK